MLKSLLFSILFVALSTLTIAQQRYTNLKVQLVSPTNGQTIYPNQSFLIDSKIYNLGPDTLFLTDSVMFQLFFGGSPIFFGTGSGTGFDSFMVDNEEIYPGDSIHMAFSFSIDTGWTGGPTTICTAFIPFNTPGNPHDTVLGNNKSCVNVTIFKASAVGNVNATAHSAVTLYPNPASTEAYLQVNMQASAQVSYKLTDLTGRVLIQEDKGMLPQGKHQFSINTATLPQGSYLYQVTTGTEVQNGRLQVR